MSTDEKKNDMKETIEELHKGLIEKMKKFSEDSKEYLKYLDLFRRNSYTLNNNLFIESQIENINKNKPAGEELTGKYMTTFKGWQKLGYKINKGENALSIIMPKQIRYFIDEDNKFRNLRYATKEQLIKIKNEELESGEFTSYYSKKALFDIKQTNCPKEDIEKVMSKLMPQALKPSNDKELDLLISDFKKYLETDGFKVKFEELNEALKGYVTKDKEIVLNSINTNTQNFKTLLHEYAHYKSEHFKRENLTKEMQEIEAESISYIVAKNHGIDTSDYSFKYLNIYAKQNIEEDLIKSQEIIKRVANDINKKLIELNELRLKEMNLDKELEEEMGRLKVKIIKSDNDDFKEERILSAKELNELMKENGDSKGELRLNVLCEKEQKVLDFKVKLDKDKGDLYYQINNNKVAMQNIKNELSNKKLELKSEIETTKVTTTTKTVTKNNEMSVSM